MRFSGNDFSSLIIKGYAESAMLRDDRWTLLTMGYKLESALQGTKLLLNKLNETGGKDAYPKNDHLIAMVQSIGSYEVYKKFYQHNISRRDAIDFIAFNPAFPKSIIYNLATILKISDDIGFYGQEEKDAIEFHLTSLLKNFRNGYPKVAEGAETEFFEKTRSRLQELAGILDQEYLTTMEA